MNDQPEPADVRLRRLAMRSWRRGIKEMDLILGGFADTRLQTLEGGELDVYESILSENDHDLYEWITGRRSIPPEYEELLLRIRAHHGIA